jgi:hypothetical protein
MHDIVINSATNHPELARLASSHDQTHESVASTLSICGTSHISGLSQAVAVDTRLMNRVLHKSEGAGDEKVLHIRLFLQSTKRATVTH